MYFIESDHTWPWGTSSFLSLSIIGIGWIPVFFISSPWRKPEREVRKTEIKTMEIFINFHLLVYVNFILYIHLNDNANSRSWKISFCVNIHTFTLFPRASPQYKATGSRKPKKSVPSILFYLQLVSSFKTLPI